MCGTTCGALHSASAGSASSVRPAHLDHREKRVADWESPRLPRQPLPCTASPCLHAQGLTAHKCPGCCAPPCMGMFQHNQSAGWAMWTRSSARMAPPRSLATSTTTTRRLSTRRSTCCCYRKNIHPLRRLSAPITDGMSVPRRFMDD